MVVLGTQSITDSKGRVSVGGPLLSATSFSLSWPLKGGQCFWEEDMCWSSTVSWGRSEGLGLELYFLVEIWPDCVNIHSQLYWTRNNHYPAEVNGRITPELLLLQSCSCFCFVFLVFVVFLFLKDVCRFQRFIALWVGWMLAQSVAVVKTLIANFYKLPTGCK